VNLLKGYFPSDSFWTFFSECMLFYISHFNCLIAYFVTKTALSNLLNVTKRHENIINTNSMIFYKAALNNF